MTKEELAARLNGRQYRSEITREEAKLAKAAGLVVVFGASDDLMEFEGAISEEISAFGGEEALVTRGGLFEPRCDNDGRGCPYAKEYAKKAALIVAEWSPKEIEASWLIKSDIPHATFDVMEDDELFCRGIVFALADVPEIAS